ncbi:SOS response-associated peptidase family protein [Mesorhizobium tamadayense]|uniref:SOS response-associated peptidase family protein n=1 Tax=Mesorhizobium tamadayense TaxID=425306 RepID=UPI001FE010B6|nr:SOS response-associated peptidase family protein [Mesorhizobium tamadayense]
MKIDVKHIQKRGKAGWRYRRKIPEELRSILGKREILIPLGPTEAIAIKKYPRVHAEAEKLLLSALSSKKAPPPNSHQSLTALEQFKWGQQDVRRLQLDPEWSGAEDEDAILSTGWQQYVGVEHRCVVPVTSFAEPSPTLGDKDPETGIQRNYWFTLNEDRPLFFFAGLWTPWHGVRKVKDGPGDFELCGFMTTAPNALVKPIHQKAMPVILSMDQALDLLPA